MTLALPSMIARNHRIAASTPTFVGWQTMTPDDPTDFHTIYRATVSYKAGDLLLVTQAGDNGPTGSTNGVPVSDSAPNAWNVSPNSMYVNESGWANNAFVLWYAIAAADGTGINVVSDASANTLYPEAGGCGLYVFRPPPGKAWSIDSSGNQAIGSGAFGTTGSLTLGATGGPGLIFIRAVGNEDNSPQTFGASIGTALGLTNSQQSWTGSTRESGGWAAYQFTSSAQSGLVCNFTATAATHIGMALDSFIFS